MPSTPGDGRPGWLAETGHAGQFSDRVRAGMAVNREGHAMNSPDTDALLKEPSVRAPLEAMLGKQIKNVQLKSKP